VCRKRLSALAACGTGRRVHGPHVGACKVVGACKFLNAKLRAFGKETALWESWFGG
jgi:hypothetical protein